MQYLLTQEEFDALMAKATEHAGLSSAELQRVCTLAADHVPIKLRWAPNEPDAPWGCILTAEGEHYCDECPARKACPYPSKEFSK